MIVVFGGEKGGTGKSHLAVSVAMWWHSQGHTALLVDADPQESVIAWADDADANEVARPSVVALPEFLRSNATYFARFDVIVIDAPGRLAGDATVDALSVADIAIIPSMPGISDMKTLDKSIDVVLEVQSHRTMRAAVMLNGADRTGMTKSIRTAIASARLPKLATEVGRRVDIPLAFGFGTGVTEHSPGSIAALEIRRLAQEIEDIFLERPAHAVA